jgi:transcriptional regulator of arginine metabolism
MQKTKRLLAIERIITGENISSQDELLKKLKGEGINCTQATLSRNLRQIGVSRIPNGAGGYRYALSDTFNQPSDLAVRQNIVSVIKSIVDVREMMIIKTIPGYANGAASYIDNAGRYEIAGTIAGDDTILVIPRNDINLTQVHYCLERILPGLNLHLKNH